MGSQDQHHPWAKPTSHPSISADEIHVWRVSLDPPTSVLQRLEVTLSPDERQRATRFHFDHLRRRFTAARGSLRAIISAYLDILPEQVPFAYEPHGKPILSLGAGESSLSFNLAHSHELALVAVTLFHRIGVDLERRRVLADAERIAARFFSPQEFETFRQLPVEEKGAAFYHCWTRKEAFLKAIGEGFSYPLDRFSVTLAPGEPPRLIEIGGISGQASYWRLFDLVPAPGYAAALAVDGSVSKLSFFQYPKGLS